MTSVPTFFAPFDWALIALLQSVKSRVVDRLIERWVEEVSSDPVLARRLAAAFLYPTTQLRSIPEEKRERLEPLAHASSSLEPKQIGYVTSLLQTHGPLLFNSYYFSLIDAFGQQCLLPILPGYNPDNPEQLQKALEYFAHRGLPFHLNDEYIATYDEQLLPCFAGRTPHYLHLYRAGVRLERVQRSDNFLGELTILYRREDFAVGHLSALVGMVGPRATAQVDTRDCLGAYILTCILPSAFSDEEGHQLDAAVHDAWSTGMLQTFAEPPRLYSRNIVSRQALDIGAAADLVRTRVASHLVKAIASEAQSGVVAARATIRDGGSALGTVAGISSDGVTRLIRSLFPTSPLLQSEHVSEKETTSTGAPLIAFGRLRAWVDILNTLLGGRASSARSLWKASADARAVLPMVGGRMRHVLGLARDASGRDIRRFTRRVAIPRIDVLPLGNGQSALVLVGAGSIVGTGWSTTAVAKQIAAAVDLAKRVHAVPEGDNPVFAAVPKLWSRKMATGALTNPRDLEVAFASHKWTEEHTKKLANTLTAQLAVLSTRYSPQAILLLRRARVYIPGQIDVVGDGPGDVRTRIEDALRTYAWYWMAERLSRLYGEDALRPAAFASGRTVVMHPIISPLPYQQVQLAANATAGVRSLLTFLGVPLGDSGKPYEWPNTDDANFLEGYRRHLSAQLANAAAMPDVQRALQHSDETLQLISITVKRVAAGRVRHTIVVEHGTQSYTATADWSAQETWDLDCAVLAAEQMMDYYIGLPPTPPAQVLDVGTVHVDLWYAQGANPHASDAFGEGRESNDLMRLVAQNIVEARGVERRVAEKEIHEKMRLVGHELQVPLNAAAVHASTAATTGDQDEARYALAAIDECQTLVRDLLTTTHGLETSEDRTAVDVAELLHAVGAEMRVVAAQKNITLTVESSPDAVEAVIEVRRVRNAIRALIDNAIKYCQSGDEVHASVSVTFDAVRVCVADTGPGIPAGDLERVFLPYERTIAARGTVPGLGLGLSMVRDTADRHGGDAWVESGEERPGTRFYFTLARRAQTHDKEAS